jgi:hypothetical protein
VTNILRANIWWFKDVFDVSFFRDSLGKGRGRGGVQEHDNSHTYACSKHGSDDEYKELRWCLKIERGSHFFCFDDGLGRERERELDVSLRSYSSSSFMNFPPPVESRTESRMQA